MTKSNRNHWESKINKWEGQMPAFANMAKRLYIPNDINYQVFLVNYFADYLICTELLMYAASLELQKGLTQDDKKQSNSIQNHLCISLDNPMKFVNERQFLTEELNLDSDTFFKFDIMRENGVTVKEFFTNFPPKHQPSKNFQEYFLEINEYRFQSDSYPYPRHFLIAFPDVVKWIYNDLRVNAALNAKFVQQYGTRLNKCNTNGEGFELFIEAFLHLSGVKRLECQNPTKAWWQF